MSMGRIWAIPSMALAGLAVLFATDGNQNAFLAINHLASELPDALWANLTAIGDNLVAFALILPFARRRPDIAAALLITVLLTLLYVHGIKHLAALPRPAAVLGHEGFAIIGPTLKAGSFPSGHTATVFALAALLGAHLPWRHLSLLLLFAGLVGISRVAVGAHWPTDVLAGAAGGWLAGLAGIALARRWQVLHHPNLCRATQIFLLLCAIWLFTSYDSRFPDARRLEQAVAFAGIVLFFRPMTRETNHV